MVSLDMQIALVPWITPIFDRGLAIFLKHGSALEKHFGDVLPFAFFLRGGPGDSPETAFRVCAPSNEVRVSAEYWLMRAYLDRRKEGPHATLAPDEAGRTFSLHHYIDQHGARKRVFFETTDSLGREEEDFSDFLNGYLDEELNTYDAPPGNSTAALQGGLTPVQAATSPDDPGQNEMHTELSMATQPTDPVSTDLPPNLFEIEMQKMSDEFFECWKAAGKHLNKQVDVGLGWLRADPKPPYLEHLSFRLGNQLFFIRIEDVDDEVRGPGTFHGLVHLAATANGRACILPMRKQIGGGWAADWNGWGLLDAETRRPINPAMLVSEEKIEMTPWEIHNMAVQVVRNYILEQGFELWTWDGNPGIDPSIWFVGSSKKPEWVVVRSATYPAKSAPRPHNWEEIAKYCASKLSSTGHFASVSLVSADRTQGEPQPLWRGHGIYANFTGLE